MIRKHFNVFFLLSLFLAFPWSQPRAQEASATSANAKQTMRSSVPEARTKDGKNLLGALDLMKVAVVAAPRISPDGSRVAYTVGEVKMEKDKEWKTVTQVWVVPIAGGKALQYTRGDKSSSSLSAWRVRLLMRQRRSPTPGEAGRTFGTPSFGLIAPTSCFSVTEYRSIRWTGRGEIVSAIR